MENVPVDGLWLDMNEPSNFCNGSCYSNQHEQWRHTRRSKAGFDLYNPPYNLNNQDKFYSLNTKTLDVYVKQYGGLYLFDTHNIYGKAPAVELECLSTSVLIALS